MLYLVTDVYTTIEGWFTVDVLFENGVHQDFIFPDMTREMFDTGRVQYTIDHYNAPPALGDDRNPYVVKGGLDPLGLCELARVWIGKTVLHQPPLLVTA